MKEEWTDKLKTRLEHHEMTPPEGLWEGISKQMNLAEKPVRRSSFPLSKRWIATAAALLALAGFFVLYDFQDDATSSSPVNIAEKAESHQAPAQEQSPEEKPVGEEAAPPRMHSLLAQAVPVNAKTAPATTESPEPSATPIITEEKVTEATADAQTAEASQASAQTARKIQQASSAFLPSYQQNEGKLYSEAGKRPRQWSFGLHASGGLLADNSHQQYDHYPISQSDPLSPSPHYESISSETPQNETPIKASHHLPIRFGLKIGYQLSERWALQTGITYTYLYSDFTLVNRQQPAIEQRLHYVGIPLGISYQIWKNSNFRLYASAGASAEKCVKNSQESGDANINVQSDSEKPLQWSVNTALGAEYQPTKQLGIYLEPSLGYYFKDNTPLEHYYKEHPLSPAIEFGLRWHLNSW
jgi:hypothetical protein